MISSIHPVNISLSTVFDADGCGIALLVLR
jgi:hypothetical protein